MPSRKKKLAKAVPFTPTDVANVAKAHPYIQRLIEDADLRENVKTAIDSGKSAYERLSNGKQPHRALLEDKKLQNELRVAVNAVKDAASALSESPKKRKRKGLTFGRGLLLVGIAGGLALVGSEKLRSKVLDTLFGAEEEFEYSPPASTHPSQPTAPVTAA